MISKEELVNTKGGANKWLFYGVGIGAAISFVIGIIDGYLRPKKC